VSGGAALDRSRLSVDNAIATYGIGPPLRADRPPRTDPPPRGNPPPVQIRRAHAARTTRARSRAAPVESALTGVDAVLDLSLRAGVPAAELLRSEAEEARRTARAEVQERASTLAVQLMLPLGLCVLPAFMVLGVVPLLVTVITSTVSQF